MNLISFVLDFIRNYSSSLMNNSVEYFQFNNYDLINKLIKYNKTHLILISRDVDEYMSDRRSKTRIFLAIITQLCLLATGTRFFLCALINEVSLIK